MTVTLPRPLTLEERLTQLTTTGRRFPLASARELLSRDVAELINAGTARTFRDGGVLWLELND